MMDCSCCVQYDELDAEVTAVLAKVAAAERRGISGALLPSLQIQDYTMNSAQHHSLPVSVIT